GAVPEPLDRALLEPVEPALVLDLIAIERLVKVGDLRVPGGVQSDPRSGKVAVGVVLSQRTAREGNGFVASHAVVQRRVVGGAGVLASDVGIGVAAEALLGVVGREYVVPEHLRDRGSCGGR